MWSVNEKNKSEPLLTPKPKHTQKPQVESAHISEYRFFFATVNFIVSADMLGEPEKVAHSQT